MTITCVFILMIATDGAFFHWEEKDSAWYWALIRDSIGGCLGPHFLFHVVMILGGPQYCLCNIVFFTFKSSLTQVEDQKSQGWKSERGEVIFLCETASYDAFLLIA